MTPESQRIAIAEACGIKNIQKGGYCYIPEGQKFARSKQVPDYLNDLNAMHEAEKVMDTRQRDVYAGFLGELTGGVQRDFGAMKINATTKVVSATASQRAEAFLRTLGLWKDDACPQS